MEKAVSLPQPFSREPVYNAVRMFLLLLQFCRLLLQRLVHERFEVNLEVLDLRDSETRQELRSENDGNAFLLVDPVLDTGGTAPPRRPTAASFPAAWEGTLTGGIGKDPESGRPVKVASTLKAVLLRARSEARAAELGVGEGADEEGVDSGGGEGEFGRGSLCELVSEEVLEEDEVVGRRGVDASSAGAVLDLGATVQGRLAGKKKGRRKRRKIKKRRTFSGG
jgi:hypothetical protein